jgi:hypothetical protein
MLKYTERGNDYKSRVLLYTRNFYMNPTKDEPVSTIAEKEERREGHQYYQCVAQGVREKMNK